MRSWRAGVVAVLLMVATACSSSVGNGSERPADLSPASPTTEPPLKRFDDVVVEAGTVSDAVFATVSIETLDTVPGSVQQRTAGRLDYGVSATAERSDLGGTAQMTLPIDPPSADDDIAAVLHLDNNNEFTLVPAVYDPNAGTVTVTVDSFSQVFSGWWNPLNWVEEAINGLGGAVDFVSDWVTGRTDPPPCANDAPEWATGLNVDASSLHVCVQSNPRDDGTERVEVLLKSNRSTMQSVTIPTEVDYLYFESQPEFFRPWSAMLAADGGLGLPIGPFYGEQVSNNILTLFGGETMSFGLTRPQLDEDVSIRTFMSERQTGANHLLGLIGGLEGDPAIAMSLAAYACSSNITGINLPAVTAPPTDIPAVIEAAIKCGLALLESPELLADTVSVAAAEMGFNADEAAEFITRKLGGNVQALAKKLGAAINVGGAVIRVFDSVGDSISEGQITLTLNGNPPSPATPPPVEAVQDNDSLPTPQYVGSLIVDAGGRPVRIEWALSATDPVVDVSKSPEGQAALNMRVAGTLRFVSDLPGRSIRLDPGGVVKLAIGPSFPSMLQDAGQNVIVSPDDPFGGLGGPIEVPAGESFVLSYDSRWRGPQLFEESLPFAIDEVLAEQVEFRVWLEAAYINGQQFKNFTIFPT